MSALIDGTAGGKWLRTAACYTVREMLETSWDGVVAAAPLLMTASASSATAAKHSFKYLYYDTNSQESTNTTAVYMPALHKNDCLCYFHFSVLSNLASASTTDMYYLLDTVPPTRVICKNVATVNILPKMAASSVISVKVCLWMVCGCKYIANKLYRIKTN